MEIDYSQIRNYYVFYLEVIVLLKNDQSNYLEILRKLKTIDSYQIISEIDLFINSHQTTKGKYLDKFKSDFSRLINLIADYFPDNILDARFMNQGIIGKSYDTTKDEILTKMISDLNFILEHIDEINPTDQKPEEKELLTAIHKMLILHYLKINQLKNFQFVWKQGQIFLFGFLGIKPSLVKDLIPKVERYTKGTPAKPAAVQFISALKEVKTFFDNSTLYEISREVENRINQLTLIP